MKSIFEFIGVIPWWLLGRLVHIDKLGGHRDYDRRSLRDWLFTPPSRTGLLLGWLFWLVLLAGIIALLKWLCQSL